jgi:hypothetical protein
LTAGVAGLKITAKKISEADLQKLNVLMNESVKQLHEAHKKVLTIHTQMMPSADEMAKIIKEGKKRKQIFEMKKQKRIQAKLEKEWEKKQSKHWNKNYEEAKAYWGSRPKWQTKYAVRSVPETDKDESDEEEEESEEEESEEEVKKEDEEDINHAFFCFFFFILFVSLFVF